MPTTPDAATSAIETRLQQALPTTPVLYPNQPFTPPMGQPFVRAHILWGRSVELTMQPTQSNLDIAILQIDIYVPQSEGAGRQRRLGEQVRAIFNRQEFESVRCEAATGLIAAREEKWNEAAYFCATVRIPFTIVEEVP
jgi:uncharacterized protein DUF4128